MSLYVLVFEMILWTSWAFCFSGDKIWGREQLMQIRTDICRIFFNLQYNVLTLTLTVSWTLHQCERQLSKENGPTANIQCLIFPSLTGALVRNNQGNWRQAPLTTGIFEKPGRLFKTQSSKWTFSFSVNMRCNRLKTIEQ